MAKKTGAARTENATSGNAPLSVPLRIAAGWAGITSDSMRRLLARYGFPSQSPIDLPLTFGGMVALLKSRESELLCDDDGDRELSRLKKQIEVETLRQKQEMIRARTELIRREWVKVADVRERAQRMGQAMRRAGEQLGQRYGAEAQDLFNGALDIGVAALVSIEPSEVDDDEYKAAKKKRGRKKQKPRKADKQ